MTRRDVNFPIAMKARYSVRVGLSILLTLFPSLILFWGLVENAAAQRRTRQRPAATSRPAVDYSAFLHSTEKHRGACVSCHKVPTKNWQRVRDFPDVADFPAHDACVSCHRRQFFRGASPQICTVCHVRSSPREDRRYAFRNPAASQQFAIEFAHDKHQDVIANLDRRRGAAVSSVFSPVAFSISPANQTTKLYNNCTICHTPLQTNPQAPAAGWADSFVPDAGTFKTAPRGHDSCFNCHWKSQAPVRTDCAGCHKLGSPHAASFGFKRLSMKFRHAREQHVAECATCHINITKSATLRGLTPDVPITACTECHNKDGLRLDVTKELEAIDHNREFVCVYCHTSDVGRRDPPASHYLIAGREPMKRSK